ncbi:hypothetical protein BDZ97DRAFT_1729638, partial [Flammula alnicola]
MRITIVHLETLRKHIAPRAFHNSAERYDPPKCHPHTRRAVLKRIMDWLNDPDNLRLFLWLYGPAGAGKSAIAQTIAEMYYEAGILGASFFFSRTASLHNESTRLIPTLAYQLSLSVPQISEHVAEAINDDSSIFERNLITQMQSLIVNPLNRAILQTTAHPTLIIIDGLDECDDPKSQRYILDSLSAASNRLTIPVHYLIASRPEQQIRDAYNTVGSLASQTLTLPLDDTYHPDDDIRTFLQFRFDEIKMKHPSRRDLPHVWPSLRDLQILVGKASGQFIYASTIMKF